MARKTSTKVGKLPVRAVKVYARKGSTPRKVRRKFVPKKWNAEK